MPSMPPPPSGSQKFSNSTPSHSSGYFDGLSGAEGVWYRFRSRNTLVQLFVWLVFGIVPLGIWITKNFTSESASTAQKIVSGGIVAIIVLALFS